MIAKQTALGNALTFENNHKVDNFGAFKSAIVNAKLKDVRKIWDSLSVRFGLSVSEGDEVFAKEHGGVGWLALEKCLGMTDDEWWLLVTSPSWTENYYEVEDENTKKEWLVEMKETHLGERIMKVVRKDE